MDIDGPLLYALIALVAAMLCRPLQERTHMPFPIFLVIIGFILSEVYTLLGFDTGVRAINFHTISQYVFIPIILFTTAFHMSPKMVLKNSIVHFLFAIPITIITIVITAVILYYGIAHPEGFPWMAAFLTAAILAATGSHAIADYLHYLKVSPRLIHILQIESLFTAILALVFFNLFITMDAMPTNNGVPFWFFDFIMDIIGGIFIGVIISYAIIGALKLVKESKAEAILLIAGVYIAYILCHVWNVSGGFAVFTLGLFLGSFSRAKIHGDQHFIGKLFDSVYLFAVSGVFLLVGTSITWAMFEERWLAMLVGIVAVIVARAISVYGGVSIYNLSKGHKPYPVREQSILVWAGMRAALPIALAFGIPTSIDYWWTIQSIVFGVVLFGLIIQAPSIRLICSTCKNVTKPALERQNNKNHKESP